MQIHTCTYTPKTTQKKSCRQKEISSHKGEEWSNNSVVLNCWLARESISPHLLLLLLFLSVISQTQIHPFFPRYPPFSTFFLLFKYYQKWVEKCHHCLNETHKKWQLHPAHLFFFCLFPLFFPLAPSSAPILLWNKEWMVCPHETSMSIDLWAALDSERKSEAGGGGVMQDGWMKVAEGIVLKGGGGGLREPVVGWV